MVNSGGYNEENIMPEFWGDRIGFTVLGDIDSLKWQHAPMDRRFMDQDFTQQIHQLPQDRRQLIFRVRRQIAEGAYETAEKLEAAFDNLLHEIVEEDCGDMGGMTEN